MTNNKINLYLFEHGDPNIDPSVLRWIMMRNIIHLLLFQVIHLRWYFTEFSFFLFGFGFVVNNHSCALNQLLFVPLKVAGIWEVWKMLLHTIDQRFFSLRTISLPSYTLIKSSSFSWAPKVFSFPPSNFKSDSTLGKLMKWLCCERDPEGLSSQRPQIPSPSIRPIHLTVRLRLICSCEPLHCGVGVYTWELAATHQACLWSDDLQGTASCGTWPLNTHPGSFSKRQLFTFFAVSYSAICLWWIILSLAINFYWSFVILFDLKLLLRIILVL